MSSRLPRMPVRRLLKSWAIPPVNWPMASIFWAWNRASRASSKARFVSVCSVMSRVIFAKPIMSPVLFLIGFSDHIGQEPASILADPPAFPFKPPFSNGRLQGDFRQSGFEIFIRVKMWKSVRPMMSSGR